MRTHAVRTQALRPADFAALRDALLSSPLVGRSTLGGTFTATRGFAVIFREAGVSRVLERFPQLGPWFDRALGRPGKKALTPWPLRVERVPNAWYLNVLMVTEGGTVARHVDATLRRPAAEPEALPELVSVLYLSVPAARGGELKLWFGSDALATIEPAENTLVHFRGDLAHEVCSFAAAPEGALRASLVVEQYHLEPDALARLPDCRVESRAGFDAWLRAHQQWTGRPFELER